MSIPLQIFPNSGHQFFTIPLSVIFPTADEVVTKQIVVLNNHGFHEWDPIIPWIRYRCFFINSPNGSLIPVMNIAVESNMGPGTRGFCFESRLFDRKPEIAAKTGTYYSCEDPARDKVVADYPNGSFPLTSLPASFQYPEGWHDQSAVTFEVLFAESESTKRVDVDLVVDLGNTRTAAVLLENLDGDGFQKRVSKLLLLPRGFGLDITADERMECGAADCDLIDSWFLLHRTLFANLEPPVSEDKIFSLTESLLNNKGWIVKSFLPHAFVELSPALIGGGRGVEGISRRYSEVSLKEHQTFCLSSPKRYAWSDAKQGVDTGTFWKQIKNGYDRDHTEHEMYAPLQGLIRYFMSWDGMAYDLRAGSDRGPDPRDKPAFPIRDAICWFALSLLESAYRQINTQTYRSRHRDSRVPRRLREVRVTYPTGWCFEEREAYFAQWERALKLFALAHFENPSSSLEGGEGPVFATQHLDEAVCSQLPLLMSQIVAMKNHAPAWFELVAGCITDQHGHAIVNPAGGPAPKLRAKEKTVIMNIDIGGGSTDISVIRYTLGDQTGAAKHLTSQVLYGHSHNVAGDQVVKRIIEKVLIPGWLNGTGASTGRPHTQDTLLRLQKFLAQPNKRDYDRRPDAQRVLARSVRLVFVPLANHLLAQLSSTEAPDNASIKLNVMDCLATGIIPFKDTQSELESLCLSVCGVKDIFGAKAVIDCPRAILETCISEVFAGLIRDAAELVKEFECHLVILSGKPSELARLREMLEEAMPILPQRIISMRDFQAGDWYPFADHDGKIEDAKTCTVVGAALYQDFQKGRLRGLKVTPMSNSSLTRDFVWIQLPFGMLAQDQLPALYQPPYQLFSERDYPPDAPGVARIEREKTFALELNCQIGRQISKMKSVVPDPIYQLEWIAPSEKSKSDRDASQPVRANVTLKWVSERGRGDKLELKGVEPIPGQFPVKFEQVKLKLKTVRDESADLAAGGATDRFWMDEPRLRVQFE